MSKIIEIIKKKWLRDTFLTIFLIVVIFSIYYLVNFIAKKINVEDIDLTTDKIYSISEATKTKLGNLDKEVTIELINLDGYYYINDFVDKYTNLNPNIKKEVINNLTARPDIMNTYGVEATDVFIIIKSGEREKLISLYDLYTYDYSTSEEIDLTEETITNGIIDVTIENKPKVYFLEGHNNYDMTYFQGIMSDIKSEANEVTTLNILTAGSVPEDCDCLVITTLREDLTEMEKDKIIEYSNNGGKILLLADTEVMQVSKSNYEELLGLYGFSISKGILVEQDLSKMVYGSPDFIISELQSGNPISGNLKMKLSMCVIDAGRIDFKDDETLNNLGVSYEKIATTSEKAFLRTNVFQEELDKTDYDEDSPNAIIGALVTRKVDGDKTSKMIVFSNGVFATNQEMKIGDSSIYANKICNNDDVVINSVSYLTERSDTITIRKGSNNVSFIVTQSQNSLIMFIIFVLPLLIIVIGIIVWQYRRRKK